MESIALRNMRLKQLIITNVFMLIAMILFFMTIHFYQIAFTPFFLALGIIVFIQGIFGLIKVNSTKKLIPFFEKIAVYEKEKMGSEWKRERKTEVVWRLVLSGILLLQAYMYRDLTELTFEVDLLYMGLLLFFLFILTNGSLILRFRKVDRSTSESDLKGYTWKANLIAVAVGIGFGLMVLLVTLLFVFSEI